jgi:beta-phosphoglucomutase-like phosphatase (HAD superfamily)
MTDRPRLFERLADVAWDSYEGLLFDCDGTLADTMPLHFEAWEETLRPSGLVFPRDRYFSMAGMPTRAILGELSREQGIAVDYERLLPLKEERFLARLGRVRPVSPVVDVARAARGSVPMAVVSGGVRRAVERTLQLIGVHEWFCAIVTAEDTTHGKPDPAPFLLAASRAGVDPRRCLVFEDGAPGFESARRAGMDAVDVRSSYEA